MMARYLRSTSTGAVLPYNKQLATRPNIEALTDEEADAYLASIGKPKDKAPPPLVVTPPPEPVDLSADVELRTEDEIAADEEAAASRPTMVSDVSDGEPSAADVLAALEVD